MEKESKYHILGAGLILVTATCSVMLGMAFKQDQMLRLLKRRDPGKRLPGSHHDGTGDGATGFG
ncbi:MAG: hypothetical protein HY551_02135 [Elusimicrobia bacterium]|nr:hypothetical protein [Elusimicrobiota bacterium]